mmetsp:Transcript_16971/g.37077  ORF Transcript_16971/g.37077 Transcript_16971/m.37077 type:complete len:289 (-) Transcript_16971:201-1067(-)
MSLLSSDFANRMCLERPTFSFIIVIMSHNSSLATHTQQNANGRHLSQPYYLRQGPTRQASSRQSTLSILDSRTTAGLPRRPQPKGQAAPDPIHFPRHLSHVRRSICQKDQNRQGVARLGRRGHSPKSVARSPQRQGTAVLPATTALSSIRASTASGGSTRRRRGGGAGTIDTLAEIVAFDGEHDTSRTTTVRTTAQYDAKSNHQPPSDGQLVVLSLETSEKSLFTPNHPLMGRSSSDNSTFSVSQLLLSSSSSSMSVFDSLDSFVMRRRCQTTTTAATTGATTERCRN